jgi:uncharacterized protein YecT (DUF1311 family)
MKTILSVLAVLLSQTASAQPCANLPPDGLAICEKGIELEVTLNATYRRILGEYDERAKNEPAFGEAKKSLIKAQQLWVKFREADCNAVYDFHADGSIRIPASLQCENNQATMRTKQLEDQYESHH